MNIPPEVLRRIAQAVDRDLKSKAQEQKENDPAGTGPLLKRKESK